MDDKDLDQKLGPMVKRRGTVIGSSSRTTELGGQFAKENGDVIIRIWRKGMVGRQKKKNCNQR